MARIRKLTQVQDGEYLTIEEAAKRLGIKPTVVRNYLYQGKMTTYKFKTLTLLSTDEVSGWEGRKKRA